MARPQKGRDFPDPFPLYAHVNGYWSKKINSKIRHFGRWGHHTSGEVVYDSPDGWKEALEKYKRTIPDILAGRLDDLPVVMEVNQQPGILMMKDLCNEFLTAKHAQLEAGEM